MRTFFCLSLPAATREAIGRVAERLRRETRMSASWVGHELLHVTVRFLGDIEPDLLPALQRAAREAVRGVSPWETSLDRIDAFPHLPRARVLWVGGEAPDSFRALTGRLEEQLQPLGFARDPLPNVAHVTIARIKGAPDPRLDDLCRAPGLWKAQRFVAEQLTLMQSELTPHGPRYLPLFRLPLDHER
ncbi:MAG: RNA 2',3'-cyclic phosphodiesterase [Candidatus Bipolaricaulota bacterium]